MDHGVVREAECGVGDSVISSADCRVTMIQYILLSGRAFNELFVFRKFVTEEYVLCVLHVGLWWNVNTNQNE